MDCEDPDKHSASGQILKKRFLKFKPFRYKRHTTDFHDLHTNSMNNDIKARQTTVEELVQSLVEAFLAEIEDDIQSGIKNVMNRHVRDYGYIEGDAMGNAERYRRFERDRIDQLNWIAKLVKWKSVIQDSSVPETSLTLCSAVREIKDEMENSIKNLTEGARLRSMAGNIEPESDSTKKNKKVAENNIKQAEKIKRWKMILQD